MSVDNNNVSTNCQAMGEVLNRIGDKWSIMIVGTLRNEAVRFNEIQRQIGGISQRMLSRTLRNLERDGIVKRTAYPEVPPRVEYELTKLGHSLQPAIEGLWNWASTNFSEIETARMKYDSLKK
ncbi:MAG: helix-turn-helix transcriptional regulator [Devosiaceae bacterium]|nr:helix-turn-helix transcriptional regulator [Devosiaceae bacterium]